MMRNLLSWWPEYRALEAEVERLETELVRIAEREAQLTAELTAANRSLSLAVEREHIANARIASLESSLQAEHAGRIADIKEMSGNHAKAVEALADYQAESRYGRRIFTPASFVPEKPITHQPIPRSRIQARTLVQQKEREFDESYTKLMEERMRQQAAAYMSASQAQHEEVESVDLESEMADVMRVSSSTTRPS